MKPIPYSVTMFGLDWKQTPLALREQVSLTSTGAAEFERDVLQKTGASGCIVLSTCNRLEVWCSGADPAQWADYRAKQMPQEVLQQRSQQEAVLYLMELACGMHSQIFGEDQILTQLEDALVQAREHGHTDPVLETLFRTARTSAKQVKTELQLQGEDASVPERALHVLEAQYGSLAGKRCLVIGNGRMGRLLCQCLLARGAQVTVTIRRYHHTDTIVPNGCHAIPYGERYQALCAMDYCFSATRSPHQTLCQTELPAEAHRQGLVLVDLAMPRDIEPSLSAVSGITLWNLEDLGTVPQIDPMLFAQAEAILQEGVQSFLRWAETREDSIFIQQLAAAAGAVTIRRLAQAERKQDPVSPEAVERAAAKTVEKLLFTLREGLSPTEWEHCLSLFTEELQPNER